ncbi:MAG TPA: DUF5702 domain-containing protein [Clostridia bacterium]|nr:DUF5702 domain-containing protein [Clostridia bacterium]
MKNGLSGSSGASGSSGQIAVFAAILIPAFLILAGVLVDVSRISTGRSMVKRAVVTSARSLLADYGSNLKDNYGIFALSDNNQPDLQDSFEESLVCNLSIPSGEDFYTGNTDLFGFRIERVNVTPIYNLSENAVTRKQILEYMKYRAPEELAEGFIEKLAAVKDVGKMAGAYKQKVGIDKLLGKMDKSQQKLKKVVDGTGSTDKYINGFNLNDSWKNAFSSFNSLSESLSTAQNNLAAIDSSINEVNGQISALENAASKNQGSASTKGEDSIQSTDNSHESSQGGDKEGKQGEDSEDSNSGTDSSSEAEKLRNTLNGLLQQRSSISGSISSTEEGMKTLFDELRNSMTNDFIEKNEDAVKEIEQIAEKGKNAQEAIKNLEAYLSENFTGDAGTFSIDFKEQTQDELDNLKNLILDGQKAEAILKGVNANSSLLKNVVSQLDLAKQNAGGMSGLTLPSGLIDTIKGYSTIVYDYSRPVREGDKQDPRDGKADAVKKFIEEKLLRDVSYEASGVTKDELPSVTKKVTGSFDKEDEEFLGTRETTGTSGESTRSAAEYGGDLGNIGNEADLYNEDGMFQENALGFVSDMGKVLGDNITSLRDNIYINEYIMGTFKNSVAELKYGDGTEKDTNLHGIEKDKAETFYDAEVEYILHGQSSQKLNCIMTKGELLLVRFGLDTLHVYTDPKKKTMATGVATAVAGWWTGGAGIPLLSNLIMCGWGMGEALIDLNDLMQGESVPVYKMKGDWKLDIGLPAQTGPKTDKRLYFNYHDYLRLFLLTMNEDKKLDRIEDIIQLNIGKNGGLRMRDSSTYIRVEAEVSMKYLFITRPFIRRELKTSDGRYLFKILVYEGY